MITRALTGFVPASTTRWDAAVAATGIGLSSVAIFSVLLVTTRILPWATLRRAGAAFQVFALARIGIRYGVLRNTLRQRAGSRSGFLRWIGAKAPDCATAPDGEDEQAHCPVSDHFLSDIPCHIGPDVRVWAVAMAGLEPLAALFVPHPGTGCLARRLSERDQETAASRLDQASRASGGYCFFGVQLPVDWADLQGQIGADLRSRRIRRGGDRRTHRPGPTV